MTTQNSSEASMVLDWIVETPATTSVDITQRFTNSARTTKITWAPLPYRACMICERNIVVKQHILQVSVNQTKTTLSSTVDITTTKTVTVS